MIAGLPRQPDGSNAEAIFHRHTYENLSRSQVTQVPGMRVNRTTRGVSVVPVAQSRQARGGVNYRGDWASGTAYSVGDLVRVQVNPGGAGAGNNYTGLWICVVACIGQQPVYPEPTGGATKYWDMLGMWPRLMNVADAVSGARQMLVAGNDPY